MPQIEFAGPFIPLVGSDLKVEDLTSQIQSERLLVYLNGLFQGPPNGSEITIITSTTFSIATLVLLGDKLTVVYSPLNKQQ